MIKLLQGILLLTLFTACQKQDMASKEQNKEAINASSSAKATSYAQSKMTAEIFNSYNWEQPVPLKRHDTVIAVKVMRIGNTAEKLGYLLVHNTKDGFGDIVQHEITYSIKGGKPQPQSITSTSLISKRTGTKKFTTTPQNVEETGRSGTVKKIVPEGYGQNVFQGYYKDGQIISTAPRQYYAANGGISTEQPNEGTDWYDPSLYSDMIDPMYTPDAGNPYEAYYSADDFREIDGILYTRWQYPAMEFGYPWAWWEDHLSPDEWEDVLKVSPENRFLEKAKREPRKYPALNIARPGWQTIYNNYPKDASGNDDLSSEQLSNQLGGEILIQYNKGAFKNACAIRVSRTLNLSGIKIPEVPGKTWKDKDGQNYFRMVDDLFKFLFDTLGEPEIAKTITDGGTKGLAYPSKIIGGIQSRGLYIMEAEDPTDFHANGHATLWAGMNCIGGNNYLSYAVNVYIWKLPQ